MFIDILQNFLKNAFLPVILFISIVSCTSEYTCPVNDADEITIGILTANSGDLEASGVELQAAAEIALADVNNYLTNLGINTKIKLVYADTKSDPAIALQKITELHNAGIKIFAGGPISSAELIACKDYINANNLLMLNSNCTATSLTIDNDNIFRNIPDNKIQAEALVTLIKEKGFESVVVCMRNDDFGDDIVNLFTANAEANGLQIASTIKYEVNETVFETLSANIETDLKAAEANAGVGKVALLTITFEEIADIMTIASDSEYLTSSKWFGTDGIAQSTAIVSDTVVAKFATGVEFQCTQLGINSDNNPVTVAIKNKLDSRLSAGYTNYAYYIYDAVFLLGKLTGLAKTDNVDFLKKNLQSASYLDLGSAGSYYMNKFGDLTSAPIEIYQVTFDKGYKWMLK